MKLSQSAENCSEWTIMHSVAWQCLENMDAAVDYDKVIHCYAAYDMQLNMTHYHNSNTAQFQQISVMPPVKSKDDNCINTDATALFN